MEKKIELKGTTTRYQMKKLNGPLVIKNKINVDKISDYAYEYEVQYNALCNKGETYNVMVKMIHKKIEGYKQQDKQKKRGFDLDLEYVVNLLRPMICHYCGNCVYILYKISREMKQWSLDRIDNSLGHTKTNVVLSCLKCNLERRCKSSTGFLFSKNLVISKLES